MTGLLELLFFVGNLKRQNKLEFLRNEPVPVDADIFPNADDTNIRNENICLQQDDASPHYAREVCFEFLNITVFLEGELVDMDL